MLEVMDKMGIKGINLGDTADDTVVNMNECSICFEPFDEYVPFMPKRCKRCESKNDLCSSCKKRVGAPNCDALGFMSVWCSALPVLLIRTKMHGSSCLYLCYAQH